MSGSEITHHGMSAIGPLIAQYRKFERTIKIDVKRHEVTSRPNFVCRDTRSLSTNPLRDHVLIVWSSFQNSYISSERIHA